MLGFIRDSRMFRSSHAGSAWGLRHPAIQQPLRNRYDLCSALHIHDVSCSCEANIIHVAEEQRCNRQTKQSKHELKQMVSENVCKLLYLALQSKTDWEKSKQAPHSTAYPTESRIRQKERQKQGGGWHTTKEKKASV